MSLPWLLIVAWPGLAQRLPRPGRWMNHLRVVLGLMMLGSALWLVSLLTIHIGRTPVLTLLVILAIALLVATAWRYRWQTGAARGRPGHRGSGRRRLCRPTGRPGPAPRPG